jgi:hypothetical protein
MTILAQAHMDVDGQVMYVLHAVFNTDPFNVILRLVAIGKLTSVKMISVVIMII